MKNHYLSLEEEQDSSFMLPSFDEFFSVSTEELDQNSLTKAGKTHGAKNRWIA